jgi:hypothetical protein
MKKSGYAGIKTTNVAAVLPALAMNLLIDYACTTSLMLIEKTSTGSRGKRLFS